MCPCINVGLLWEVEGEDILRFWVAQLGYSIDMPERLFVLKSFLLSCGSKIKRTDFLLLPLSLHLISHLLLMLKVV